MAAPTRTAIAFLVAVVAGAAPSAAIADPPPVRPVPPAPPARVPPPKAQPRPVPPAAPRTAKLTEGRPVAPRVAIRRENVTNANLAAFGAAHQDDLEILVPAARGHVYFRVGAKVYDFSEDGLRIGGVRPISNDRYGFLVPLTPAQTERLRAHLDHLEATKAAELGPYDFNGEKGFHCVSWFNRIAIGDHGETLDELARAWGARQLR